MKKRYKILSGISGLVVVALIAVFFYLNSGSLSPDNTVWEAYIGRDTTVGILPDQYANYFTYTVVRTNKNTGFKIKGKYPDSRYFSFNVYGLGDNSSQGSLVDYQIQSDSGRPNPFVAHKDSMDTGEYYTVHVVPSGQNNMELPNALTFNRDVRLLTMVIRLYDYNVDDFGGVEFPTVEAFNMKRNEASEELIPRRLPQGLNLRTIVRNVSLPGMVDRLSLLYRTEKTVMLDGPQKCIFRSY